MARTHDTMMNPAIEELLGRVDSKFALVTLASRRARQINSYFGQLGEGLGAVVPPQVTSVARKPLSIGFEEIAADKIVAVELPEEQESDLGGARSGSGRRGARRDRLIAPVSALAGRRIVLGVSGGIAAYKAIEVCRRLVDAGAHVAPVLTTGAQRFVGATTFSALASEPVHTSLWDDAETIPHTRLGQTADLVVVAPATARRDRGLRRRHLERPPGGHAAGHACAGDRLPGHAHRDVGAPRRPGEPHHAPPAGRPHRRARDRTPGRGRHGGRPPGRSPGHRRRGRARADRARPGGAPRAHHRRGTREPIDAVRVITNRSSGKQGHALADEAARRGAKVTLVSTVPRPVAVRSGPGSGRDRGGDGRGRHGPGRPGRRGRDGGRGGRLPPGGGRRREAEEGERPTPHRAGADHGHPGRARSAQTARARSWSASPRRPTTSPSTPQGKLRRKHLDLIVANDVSAPGRRASTTTRTR